MNKIKALFREASTWRGIVLCISAFGLYEFSPDQERAIDAILVAIFGAAHFMPDNLKDK